MADVQIPARDPGYYWLWNKAKASWTIARWLGDYWYFMGSVHMIADDEYDDEYASDRKLIMDEYEIGDRIAEPAHD